MERELSCVSGKGSLEGEDALLSCFSGASLFSYESLRHDGEVCMRRCNGVFVSKEVCELMLARMRIAEITQTKDRGSQTCITYKAGASLACVAPPI